MPDPHDNTKMTGDTHAPEVESDLPLQQGSPDAAGGTGDRPRHRGKGAEAGPEARPGRGSKKAGVLKDSDEQNGAGGAGTLQESGEDSEPDRPRQPPGRA
jgi:hypothetical protein